MNKVTKRTIGVICGVILILGAILIYDDINYHAYGSAKENNARLNTQNIQKACKSYHLSRGKYPAQLSDLIGDNSFIDGGERALIDPWGKPYQYYLLTNANGEAIPVV